VNEPLRGATSGDDRHGPRAGVNVPGQWRHRVPSNSAVSIGKATLDGVTPLADVSKHALRFLNPNEGNPRIWINQQGFPRMWNRDRLLDWPAIARSS
jgi:hypothetical protein